MKVVEKNKPSLEVLLKSQRKLAELLVKKQAQSQA